jgi:5-methylcytosine-specific restriction endonuclease McrA
MSKRSKACDIPLKVRQAVYKRDGGLSVISGRPGVPNAHYIPRSLGGLGIEQNIVTLTPSEHHEYDNGKRREKYREIIKAYLDEKYPGFPDEKRIYNRWRL